MTSMTADGAQPAAQLVVLRGNSGSGKSTVARALVERLDRGRCVLVEQDRIRRDMLREHDVADGDNIDLIETIATWGLRHRAVVVEGILNAHRYGAMLQRLSVAAEHAWFYAWDLSFAETARRHELRPQRSQFTPAEMADWYHGWQPLRFVREHRFDESTTIDDAVERLCADLESASA